MSLDEYRRKRKFDSTPEPAGQAAGRGGMSFVVQKHRASRLHYDFRLEMEGVLRSWAVPRGPSLDPAEKRLAVRTEDHPVDYGDFEGVIPKGNYGAGKVIIWDRGTYEMVDPPTPGEGWRKRKFHIVLRGQKLQGEWVLVETRSAERQWLFFKVEDAWATGADITEDRPESVVSGLDVEEIGTPVEGTTRRWHVEIERELERLGVKKGKPAPFPHAVSPMLATPGSKAFDDDEWLFEIKFDGVRALAYRDGNRFDLRTRNQKPLGRRFPEITRELQALRADSAVIDGEIVVMDDDGRSRFSRIQPRIHLTSESEVARAEAAIPVWFQAFDLVYLNGYRLTRLPLETRKDLLRRILPVSGRIRFTDHVAGQGKAFFEAAAALDLEGVVAKRRTSAYHERRSREWIKIKTTRTGEFVIAGYTPSSGSRKYFGALVLGLYGAGDRLVYVGRAGSGFDSKSLKSVFGDLLLRRRETSAFDVVPDENANVQWVEPELVCSVRFNEWTPDGKLRAPVFVSLCEDIEPSECVLREEPSGDIEPESRGPESDSVRSEAEAGPHKVELTNLNKVFWPDDGWTKGDLIHFYREVAEFLNPHLDQRLLVLKRYPNGITGEHFYQKDSPGHTPAWVPTAEEWSEETERSIRYVVGGRTDTLVYLANLGAISVNPWHSRIGRLDRPDYAIFDLDPGPGVEFDVARKVALELKRVLDDLELRAYPKTSGATGIHVYLPLIEDAFSYQDVRVFTEAIASIVVARVPELATIERVVRRRPVAVYVDYLQNVRGKTVAAVYSVRARPGAPVSTPLGWGELGRRFEPTRFHMKNLFRRLARTGDLFGPVLTDRQDIAPFLEALSPKR